MILFLRSKGSAFAESLARIAGPGLDVLDLDAVQDGAPVSVVDEQISWQGRDLAAARAVIVEELEFAWPQPLRGARDRGESDAAARAHRDRAERSLAVSALSAAAERTPMIDPPALAHLAVAPLTALSLLAEQGVRVQPWRLEAARPERAAEGDEHRLWLDPVGRDRWYAPASPLPGEPAWSPDLTGSPASTGEILSVLVVGARVVGGLCFAHAEAWTRGEEETHVHGGELEAAWPACAAAALASARVLGAQAAEVSLVRETAAVLSARPGPDWSRWEAALGASVPRALWEHVQDLEPR